MTEKFRERLIYDATNPRIKDGSGQDRKESVIGETAETLNIRNFVQKSEKYRNICCHA